MFTKLGKPSAYVCPECSGTLFEVREGKPLRYRCRVGHAYSKLALIAEQAEATEAALWSGMRSLREQVDLLKLSANDYPTGSKLRQELYKLSQKADEQAIQLRNLIEQNEEALIALRGSQSPNLSPQTRRKGLTSRRIRGNTHRKQKNRQTMVKRNSGRVSTLM